MSVSTKGGTDSIDDVKFSVNVTFINQNKITELIVINISFEGPKNSEDRNMEQIIFVTDEDTKTPEEVAGVLSFQGSFTLKRSLRNYHEFSKSAGFGVRSDESLRCVNHLDSNPFYEF